jgi:osmotically inducible protein OsmC
VHTWVEIGPTGHGGFALKVTLDIHRRTSRRPRRGADGTRGPELPVLNATRGNIEVTLSVDGAPIERSAA